MATTHATRQDIGTRSHQCDAARANTTLGIPAFVLLDGIGSTPEVQRWTRTTASRLTRAAASLGAAHALRDIHTQAAETHREAGPWSDLPSAVAVVATVTGGTLTVAWCGDARAYLRGADGTVRRLTSDHNERQMLLDLGVKPGRYARNIVTSCLGDTGEEPRLGVVTVPAVGRLLLASDGAYEPLEDAGVGIAPLLKGGSPREAANRIVARAIDLADPVHTDNATCLVADL